MADIAGTYTSSYTGPQFTHRISYSQTDRTGTSVTYAFKVESWMGGTSSSFGYELDWNLSINGQGFSGVMRYGSGTTATWTAPNVYTTNFSVTVTNAGAGGGVLDADFWTTRTNTGNSGKIDTGWKTVSISAWNTKPYWDTDTVLTASPTGTIPENTTSITVSLNKAALDTESNTRYYTFKRYVNGSYSATIAADTTSTSVTDSIGSGNQGYTYSYTVEVNDGSLWADSGIPSNTVTKNVLTAANISTSSSIAYSTGSVTFSISGAGNTNGSGVSYTLSCDKVTVYNPSASPTSVTIYKSGNLPGSTITYIRYDELHDAISGSNYVATLTFTLQTKNNYGSSGTKSCGMSVDLRTNPSAISTVTTGGTYTISSSSYYIPNRKAITVSWSASTDSLGGAMVYDVQYKLGSGSFTTIKSNLSTTSTSFTLGSVSDRTTCVIRVIAKTTFGYTATKDSGSIVLDYYNPPTVGFNSTIRNQTDMTASGTIYLNTSIPSVTVSTLTYSGKASSSLALATTFTKQETGLVDTDTYTFSVTVQDTAGAVIGTAATTASITISKYTPAMSVRELGVGINAFADANYKFVVGGNMRVSGTDPTLTIRCAGGGLQGEQGKILFDGDSTQSVQMRFSTFDSERAPFGLIIEKGESNTQTTSKAYLSVEGDIVSGGNLVVTGTITSDGTAVSLSGHTHSYLSSSGGTLSGSIEIKSAGSPKLEIRSTDGGTPFIDFSNDASIDYDARIILVNSDILAVQGAIFDVNSGLRQNGNVILNGTDTWLRTTGNTGWYSATYDGGWWMTDTLWIRAYNDKGIYTKGQISCSGNMSTSANMYANEYCFNGLPASVTTQSDGSWDFWFSPNGWRMHFDGGNHALYRKDPNNAVPFEKLTA